MLDTILSTVDISFKWILLAFNFLTILVIYIHKSRNRPARQHNILFIIAHPDDQCMFFRPTIMNLKKQYFVHLLCLSGKGTQREGELRAVGREMGVQVGIVVDQGLADGLKEKWCEDTIREYVCKYIAQNNIRAVFTFDQYGISDHPNHKSINSALKSLQIQPPAPAPTSASTAVSSSPQSPSSIKIYYLISVSLPRKYCPLVQLLFAILSFNQFSWIQFSPIQAYKTMAMHKSQFVWYRRLWVFFSRYQYVNGYRRAVIGVNKKEQEGKIGEIQNEKKKGIEKEQDGEKSASIKND